MPFISEFWRRFPALLLGLLSLIGTASALAWHPIYLLAALGLLLPLWNTSQRTLGICALFLCLIFYSRSHLQVNTLFLPDDRVEGEGIFHIDNLSIIHSPFNRSYLYKGTLRHFHTKDGDVYSVPCNIFHPLKHPPLADKDYLIEGTLLQKKKHTFCLKPKKGKKWIGMPNTFSFAQLRFQAKRSVSSYIKKNIKDASSATFLSALVTGEVDERSLRIDFSRLGLQHIVAISGFHFSFFAMLLHLLLRPFFSFKLRIPLLILSLGGYFFFLGNAPSILRAFITISILLIGQWSNHRTSGLNTLGVALLVELLLDPLVVTQLSFQLSFLCTLALLLFFRCIYSLSGFLFVERNRQQLREMPFLDRQGYLVCKLLRNILSLNLAVHLLSLPVLLHLFHKFPLLSLVYNLFFPFCVTLSLLFLSCAFFTLWIPPLSAFFHFLNKMWTSSLLELTTCPPAYFDLVLRCDTLSFPLTVCCLFIAFYLGMFFHAKQKPLL